MGNVDVKRTTETGTTPTFRHPYGNGSAQLAPAPNTDAEGTAHTEVAPSKPLVPPGLAAVLGVLATLGGFAAGLLSAPASWVCAALALVLGTVAGVAGLKVPSFSVGKPMAKAGMVAPLLALAGLLVSMASTLPDGYARGGALSVAVVCFGLAGAPFPQPTKATP